MNIIAPLVSPITNSHVFLFFQPQRSNFFVFYALFFGGVGGLVTLNFPTFNFLLSLDIIKNKRERRTSFAEISIFD